MHMATASKCFIVLLGLFASINAQNDCGGLIEAPSGEVTYKVGVTYNNYESCTWTIQVGSFSTVSLQLQQDGFESGYDFLTVVSVANFDTAELQFVRQIDAGQSQVFTVPGPLVFVTFQTDSSVTGTGFRLTFAGENPVASNYTISNEVVFPNATGATQISYPVNATSYAPNEFHTTLIVPPAVANQQPQSYIVLEQSDIEASNNCVNDTLAVYSFYYGDFILQPEGRVCEENWTGTREPFGAAGAFLLIFKSNGANERAGYGGIYKLTLP